MPIWSDLTGDETIACACAKSARDATYHSTSLRSRPSPGAPDSTTLFYVRLDPEHRPRFVYRHRLGTDPKNDPLIYEEKDLGFEISVGLDTHEAVHCDLDRRPRHVRKLADLTLRNLQPRRYWSLPASSISNTA